MARVSWNQRLSRRERQVVEILVAMGEGTAAEIQERLPDPPGYSAVRALLRVMEEKGVLAHRNDGPRYIYRPAVAAAKARESILRQFVDSVFGGSGLKLMSALLDPGSAAKLSEEDLAELSKMIEEARGGER